MTPHPDKEREALRFLAEWAGGSWFNMPASDPIGQKLRREGVVHSYRHALAPRFSMQFTEDARAALKARAAL